MPQTDLRVVKTLKQIDQALLESLSEMPFEKITVDQLCQTAIINRSTFYKYYKSKYDLMEQYLKRTLNEFQKQMNVAFINASPENIHHLIYQKNFEKALRFIYKHKKELPDSVDHSHGIRWYSAKWYKLSTIIFWINSALRMRSVRLTCTLISMPDCLLPI